MASDAIYNIAIFLMYVPQVLSIEWFINNDISCRFLGFLTTFGGVAAILWHMCASFFFILILQAVHPLAISNYLPKFHYFTWSVTILCSMLPLLFEDG